MSTVFWGVCHLRPFHRSSPGNGWTVSVRSTVKKLINNSSFCLLCSLCLIETRALLNLWLLVMILPVSRNCVCQTGKVPLRHLYTQKNPFAKVFNILYTDPCYLFFPLDSVTVLTISFYLLSNLSIIHQRGQSVSCSCIVAKLGKLTSVSDFTEATVGVWECCRRMYPNTAIVLDFFIFLFSTLTESVTTRPASASLQLGEHLKEE